VLTWQNSENVCKAEGMKQIVRIVRTHAWLLWYFLLQTNEVTAAISWIKSHSVVMSTCFITGQINSCQEQALYLDNKVLNSVDTGKPLSYLYCHQYDVCNLYWSVV